MGYGGKHRDERGGSKFYAGYWRQKSANIGSFNHLENIVITSSACLFDANFLGIS